MGVLVLATLLAVGIVAVPASAQEASVLEVASATFTNADGETPTGGYPFGSAIHGYLDLHNTGTGTVTGVTGTLSFERGGISVATVSFPDVEPGATVRNADPFVFSYGEAVAADDIDADCVIFLDGLDLDDDEVVIEETDGDVVTRTDESTDPSDEFEEIPPGGLVFTISSSAGEVEYVHTWSAVCSAFASGGAEGGVIRRDSLPTTGATPWSAAAGALLVMLGVGLRRRALAR